MRRTAAGAENPQAPLLLQRLTDGRAVMQMAIWANRSASERRVLV